MKIHPLRLLLALSCSAMLCFGFLYSVDVLGFHFVLSQPNSHVIDNGNMHIPELF